MGDLEGKVQGINSNSSNILDKIKSLEDETKSHSQSLVTIQESMAIQVDNMKKVDSVRQNAAARAKEDLDVANAANAKAIDDKLQAMNRDLEEKLNDAKKKVEKNADDIAGQNNLLKEHNDSINGNMTSITSLSNKLAASEKDIDSLQKQVSSNTEDIDSLKEKVKLNQDHLKTVDDTLDGLHKSNEMFEGRHVETVEKMKEVAVLASSVQSQVREQEEKIVEQSTNNLNVINEQIKNLENQQGVSVQKISELDSGTQALLEKMLGVEKSLGDGISQLEAAVKNIMDTLSNLNGTSNEQLGLLKKDIEEKYGNQTAEIENVKGDVSSNSALLKSLEPRVKGNEDHIKHIDDTLDGLKTSLDNFASKQVEDAEKTSQLNVLINNTQLQLKEQENKFVEQSNSDLNLIKNQINDLENQTGVSQQKIVELDNGSQALLEKILGLENGVNDKIGTLNEKDNALQNQIEGLKSISQANSDGIQKEVNGKLVELKEEYITTTNSLRTETQTLTQSLQESKSQQVSIEKRVNEIDSGNQQLLEKILAVEQDLEGKVKGINSNSSNISDKIMSLEDETKSHSQSLVTIQESMAIQVDNMKKVDSERQNAAASAKEDLDVANAANEKAIDDKLQAMNRDLEDKLNDAKKKVEKNADDIAGQNNLLKEHNDSINGNMTSITRLSNKLAASEKDI